MSVKRWPRLAGITLGFVLAGLAVWFGPSLLVASGPGIRSEDTYGRNFAADYGDWLEERGRNDSVKGCVVLRSGLDVVGPPGWYWCEMGNGGQCILVIDGEITEMGRMSRDECQFLIDD